jgi:hypothetical protein
MSLHVAPDSMHSSAELDAVCVGTADLQCTRPSAWARHEASATPGPTAAYLPPPATSAPHLHTTPLL